eukprot:TRINITY_DN3216_c0_g1_i2.p1 TRINITY_DN3216_c0_g1~~TRINITY_DN3216_c0_g1_i2.p1  ORF type:complete len:282 (-),score=112.64 TRINITY_DN3216_c0_g1_i2:52-897(-)
MAANFWESSHYKCWLKSLDDLSKIHKKDRTELKVSSEDIRRLKNHFCVMITNLAKRLLLRQRAIATAIVLFRRFYCRRDFVDFDPRLLGPACVYVACKVEECSTLASLYKLEKEIKLLDTSWPYSQKELMACEFTVLDVLEFQLIVYHPYRSLATNTWLMDGRRSYKCANSMFDDSGLPKELLDTVWAVLNDSYYTDVCLLQPPYVVALAALLLVALNKSIDVRAWFAELDVDMKQIWTVATELLQLYEQWDRDQKDKTDINSFAEACQRLKDFHAAKTPK